MRLRANLDALDPARFERVIDALLAARGYAPRFGGDDPEALKAIGDDDPPERFESRYMDDLWQALEGLFSGYIDRVLGDVDALHASGALSFPIDLTKGQDRLVFEALAKRAARLITAIGLPPLTADEVAQRAPGAVDLVTWAYQLGAAHERLDPHAPLEAVLQVARAAVPTKADREAIAHLKASAGSYLRPAVRNVPEDVMQRLLARDRQIAARRAQTGVRARIHPMRLAGHMADLTGHKVKLADGRTIWQGGTWDRDWRRVARTELARAYNYGHLNAALRAHPVNDGAAAPAEVKAAQETAERAAEVVREAIATEKAATDAAYDAIARAAEAEQRLQEVQAAHREEPDAPAVAEAREALTAAQEEAQAKSTAAESAATHRAVAEKEHAEAQAAADAVAAPLKVPKRLVFKITQKPRYNDKGQLVAPCRHCYRIWRTDDATPRLYPLDEVIANGENAVGEDGRPRKAAEWVATIGPTHPNDLCGPILFYNPMMAAKWPGFAAQIAKFAGQGYEGVP